MVAPVPAGINLPTITFSFKPISLSSLPETAASVRTRVVSWNEAAEINDLVLRLAFLFRLWNVDTLLSIEVCNSVEILTVYCLSRLVYFSNNI